jgi:peptide deformylase
MFDIQQNKWGLICADTTVAQLRKKLVDKHGKCHFPDNILCAVNQEIANDEVIVSDSDGIGLAATQVNQHLQVVVMDVPDSGEDYQLILENRTTKNKLNKMPCK